MHSQCVVLHLLSVEHFTTLRTPYSSTLFDLATYLIDKPRLTDTLFERLQQIDLCQRVPWVGPSQARQRLSADRGLFAADAKQAFNR
jgi:hypothetical protein